ncbi:hypothetical protein [Amnibacterium kyonggiense]|uniref:Uncharacterized protein n=1 Tax=Amnibacterium kyonggiense TaxID=595671 RepID=A0A4R7FM67_9MICO|nr:hypothetical protein [Amnibacterium kyonggiense]TDS77540.1 hypothetical protein CLV52_2492 [Amnibacterium kyonggiense]
MEQDGRPVGSGADGLGAFAAPAGALPVLVIEEAGREAVWDELLLEPSPPRPVRFVSRTAARALRSPLEVPSQPRSGFVVAAAGPSAGAALGLAAADDRVRALLLVDPVASPVDLAVGVRVLVVRSGDHADDGIALPDGEGRAIAVARIRSALAAPPFVPSARR